MSFGVSVRSVEKSFGVTKVVRGVSLDVAPGEFVSLLGPSGCGKTTLLRIIAGLERADEGEIEIGGKLMASPTVFEPPERRGIAMVFQSYAVFPQKTVAENVAYPLLLASVPRDERTRRVRQALSTLRLELLAERLPHELSGGQLQRVALARGLVGNPRVLLLDEPLSNLDAALREEMQVELASLKQRLSVTTLFVTHDQREALALSDRVAVLREGRVEQLATPEVLYQSPATPFVASFVGAANVFEGVVKDQRLLAGNASFALPSPEPEGPATFAARAEDFERDEEGTELPVLARLYLGPVEELRLCAGPLSFRLVGPPRPPAPFVRVRLQRLIRF